MTIPDTQWTRLMLSLPWTWWPSPLELRAAENVPVVDLPALLANAPRGAEGAEA